jgi:hypothetical protein
MAAPRPITIRETPFPVSEEPPLAQIANAIAGVSTQLGEIRNELTSIKEIIVAVGLRNSQLR